MKKLSKEEEYENDYAEYCRENEQNLKETFVNDNYLDEFDKFCRNEFDNDRERTKEILALKQKEL